jgi:hypothetical protein
MHRQMPLAPLDSTIWPPCEGRNSGGDGRVVAQCAHGWLEVPTTASQLAQSC